MWIEAVNVFGKWLTALVAVVTAAVGVAQYLDQRDLEIQQKVLEVAALDRQSKQKFLDTQFDLYTEAVAVVSRLATGAEYENREKDQIRFWELYWGELGMVEDRQVAQAMVKAGEALKKKNSLEVPSLHLSRCISKSIEANWGVKLETEACPYSN
jgi:hypothetical protein